MLRPEVTEYALRRFEEELTKVANSRGTDVTALERRKVTIEQQIANCTNAIADGQPSRFLIAELAELERELETVAGKITSARPEAVRSHVGDTRKFVEVRLRDLRKLLNGEPRIARAAIGERVQKITLTPEGKTYIASGSWDLLGAGAVAVSMVPGARFAPRVPPSLAYRSPPDG